MSTCQALILGPSITETSLVLFLTYSLRLELGEEICEVIGVRKAVLAAGMVLGLVVDVVPDNAVAHACEKKRQCRQCCWLGYSVFRYGRQ